jgi:WD40 repeat protein
MTPPTPAVPLRVLWQTTLNDYITSLVWSPDGSALLAVPTTGPISILTSESGQPLRQFPGHGIGNGGAAWSPSSPAITSFGQDGQVVLHPLSNDNPRKFSSGKTWVEAIQWHPTGDWLAIAVGKKLHLLNPDFLPAETFEDHPGTISDLAWSPDGQQLASVSYLGPRLWQPGNSQPTAHLSWPGSSLSVAWSPSGRHLATGNQTASVHFWNLEAKTSLHMRGYETKVKPLSWSSDERYLATAGGPDAVVWNCSGSGPEGSTPIILDAHTDWINCLSFQHRSPLLATGSQDSYLYVWWPERSDRPLLHAKLPSGITRLAWHPNDTFIAIATDQGHITVARLPSEKELN